MNNKTSTGTSVPTTKRVFPIRFHKLRVGSDYQIFAEPSRNIRKSSDTRTYTKVQESFSVAKGEKPERAIILYPDDLVIPLSRGQQ